MADSRDPDFHYISPVPYDAEADLQALDRADLDASTWVLIWRRFRRNKLALISGVYLLLIYLSLPFIDFLAPYGPGQRNRDALYAPPQEIEFFTAGHFAVTYPTVSELDLETYQPVFTSDYDNPLPVRFLTGIGKYIQNATPQTDFSRPFYHILACVPESH